MDFPGYPSNTYVSALAENFDQRGCIWKDGPKQLRARLVACSFFGAPWKHALGAVSHRAMQKPTWTFCLVANIASRKPKGTS
jgi:hypothetical protein